MTPREECPLTTPQRETINKLLKKQAPKTNKRAANDNEGEGPGQDPTMIRWVSNREGSRLGLPEELVASSHAGAMFRPPAKMTKMVEEV